MVVTIGRPHGMDRREQWRSSGIRQLEKVLVATLVLCIRLRLAGRRLVGMRGRRPQPGGPVTGCVLRVRLSAVRPICGIGPRRQSGCAPG
jgi:hypothetical protein